MTVDTKKKVLIIDDSKISQDVLVHILKTTLHFETVEAVADGLSALKKLHADGFDICLLDWYLIRDANLSGPEVLEKIREDKKFNSVRIIVMVPEDTIPHVEQTGIEIKDILSRPLNIQSVSEVLHES